MKIVCRRKKHITELPSVIEEIQKYYSLNLYSFTAYMTFKQGKDTYEFYNMHTLKKVEELIPEIEEHTLKNIVALPFVYYKDYERISDIAQCLSSSAGERLCHVLVLLIGIISHEQRERLEESLAGQNMEKMIDLIKDYISEELYLQLGLFPEKVEDYYN